MLVSEALFAEFAQESPEGILVALRNGRLLGFGALEQGAGYISDLWVSPRHEGQGVGTSLIKALERRAAGQGLTVVEIEAMTANRRALELYQHLGYAISWQAERYDEALQMSLHKTRLTKAL